MDLYTVYIHYIMVGRVCYVYRFLLSLCFDFCMVVSVKINQVKVVKVREEGAEQLLIQPLNSRHHHRRRHRVIPKILNQMDRRKKKGRKMMMGDKSSKNNNNHHHHHHHQREIVHRQVVERQREEKEREREREGEGEGEKTREKEKAKEWQVALRNGQMPCQR